MKIHKNSVLVLLLVLLPGVVFSEELGKHMNKPPSYVLKQYMKMNSFPEKGEVVGQSEIEFHMHDFNGDGHEDWYLSDPSQCGSSGCYGSVYIFRVGTDNMRKYCYAGDLHQAGLKMKNIKLKCEKRNVFIEIKRETRPYG